MKQSVGKQRERMADCPTVRQAARGRASGPRSTRNRSVVLLPSIDQTDKGRTVGRSAVSKNGPLGKQDEKEKKRVIAGECSS